MVWKFCEIWKILWELASRLVKFCEILSHSVSYSMYALIRLCILYKPEDSILPYIFTLNIRTLNPLYTAE